MSFIALALMDEL